MILCGGRNGDLSDPETQHATGFGVHRRDRRIGGGEDHALVLVERFGRDVEVVTDSGVCLHGRVGEGDRLDVDGNPVDDRYREVGFDAAHIDRDHGDSGLLGRYDALGADRCHFDVRGVEEFRQVGGVYGFHLHFERYVPCLADLHDEASAQLLVERDALHGNLHRTRFGHVVFTACAQQGRRGEQTNTYFFHNSNVVFSVKDSGLRRPGCK